jgi:uncharacterized protein
MNAKEKRTVTTVTFLTMIVMALLVFEAAALALEVPRLNRRVNDMAGILDNSQESSLEELLIQTERRTSSQVVLLIIPSLRDESLEDYSHRVAQENKIGQGDYDNGVLVLVSMGDRKIRIEVGYGLEPILTDIKSDYIIRKLMASEFKKKRYYQGIYNGMNAVTGLITKDFKITPEQLAKFRKGRRRAKGKHLPLGFIVFIILIILSSIKSRGRHGHRRGGGFFFWGGGFGGGSGGGGGGGGGFGGFSGGGGSFGGGGSSGGW